MLTFLSLEPRTQHDHAAGYASANIAPREMLSAAAKKPKSTQMTATGQTDQPSTLEKVWKQTPNAITVAGYALGLWWCVGGPTWAAIVSILADELDGRLARSMGTTSDLGSILDLTADVALVPMSLLRFGRATNLGAIPLLAAPPILLNQAQTRSAGWRPPVGSWRAAIMIAAILAEGVGSLRHADTSPKAHVR